MKPRLLDLFCGAGGASMGYHRAGFDVVGIDIKPQPRYPFPFIQADALKPPFDLKAFDVIHASPPCQQYSVGRHWVRGHQKKLTHPELIEPIRSLLAASERLWIIENVVGAPLRSPIVLCGSMFKLRIEKGYLCRHRLFELSLPIKNELKCSHSGIAVGVYGHGAGGLWKHRKANAAEARALLQIDWMNRDEMSESIPPAYTEFIGQQLLAVVRP